MPNRPNLETLPAADLAAELRRREEQAQAEQAEADAAWKEEQANRARPILATWQEREEELIAAERHAYDAFKSAVIADPMVAAYIAYRWHRHRRAALRTEAQTAAHILGDPETADRIVDLREWGSTLNEDVVAVADTEARRLASEDSETVMQQLQRPTD